MMLFIFRHWSFPSEAFLFALLFCFYFLHSNKSVVSPFIPYTLQNREITTGIAMSETSMDTLSEKYLEKWEK